MLNFINTNPNNSAYLKILCVLGDNIVPELMSQVPQLSLLPRHTLLGTGFLATVSVISVSPPTVLSFSVGIVLFVPVKREL